MCPSCLVFRWYAYYRPTPYLSQMYRQLAALFQCRSYPGVSPQRCFALILAKSYPIFWQVCTCQAARLHITIPAFERNKKHRKTRTTQAGFLLSEDSPLTVLGSSMMLHHCLRLRDLSTGIFSYDDSAFLHYRTYIRDCQVLLLL